MPAKISQTYDNLLTINVRITDKTCVVETSNVYNNFIWFLIKFSDLFRTRCTYQYEELKLYVIKIFNTYKWNHFIPETRPPVLREKSVKVSAHFLFQEAPKKVVHMVHLTSSQVDLMSSWCNSNGNCSFDSLYKNFQYMNKLFCL